MDFNIELNKKRKQKKSSLLEKKKQNATERGWCTSKEDVGDEEALKRASSTVVET